MVLSRSPYVFPQSWGEITPAWNVWVDGQQADANSYAFIKARKGAYKVVKVKVKPRPKWFDYCLSAEWPPLCELSRARHQSTQNWELQDAALDASMKLGVDDDDRHVHYPGDGHSGIHMDDVPYYIDFYICNDRGPMLFNQYGFGDDKYNNIRDKADANTLAHDAFANMKQVGLLEWPAWPGGPPVKYGGFAGDSAHPPIADLFVLLYKVGSTCFAHEWMHTRGVKDHRNTSEAIVNELDKGGGEINCSEYYILAPP